MEVGEMFNVLSYSLPYEKLLTKLGHTAEHCFPRPITVTDQLIKRGVDMNVPLLHQQRKPISDMWDGFDRFMKTAEFVGKCCHDLTAHSQSVDK